MTLFEFVFGLIAVVTSLALAHMISGVVSLLRNDARLCWRHGFWMWATFVLLIGNWAGYWDNRNDAVWTTQGVLVSLGYMILLYAVCALMIPQMEKHERVDLVAFHETEGRRYVAAHALFAGLAIGVNFGLGGFTAVTISNSLIATIGLALCGVAYFAKRVWIQTVAAAGLAAFTTVFMVMQLRSLTA